MKVTIFALAIFTLMPALAQTDLLQAFQREHTYLTSQREVLRRQIRQQEKDHQAEMKELTSKTLKAERELVFQTTKNDELFQTVQELEKKWREQNSRDGSLAVTHKKARQVLADIQSGLRFETAARATSSTVLETPTAADIARLGTEALELLDASTRVERSRLAVRDSGGELREKEVLRIGRVGAQALDGDRLEVLGPAGDGTLQEIGVGASLSSLGSLVPVYLFDRLNEKALVSRPASMVDRAASAAPAVLLGALFFLVAGLFWALARE